VILAHTMPGFPSRPETVIRQESGLGRRPLTVGQITLNFPKRNSILSVQHGQEDNRGQHR